jgi:hypothetical protein
MSSPNVVMFGNLAKQITETYEKKDTDYKGSYHESVERFGYVAGIIRMTDKLNRAENLLLGDKEALVNDESAVDTLLDLAAYAIMTAMEVINRKK